MDNADKKRIIEATADWENGMRQREAATDSPLPQTTEKDRRVYYQDLVYAACNTLDRLLKLRICCGTVNSPTSEFRDALKLLTDRFMELAAEHAATMPIYSPPTDAGEQVKELRYVASVESPYDLQDVPRKCLNDAADTIERLDTKLRYIDKRIEEQIQDRIRLGEALIRATAELAAVKAERDKAVEVIERLPKTADGVPIVPNDHVWMRMARDRVESYLVSYIEMTSDGWGISVNGIDWRDGQSVDPSDCYSTRDFLAKREAKR